MIPWRPRCRARVAVRACALVAAWCGAVGAPAAQHRIELPDATAELVLSPGDFRQGSQPIEEWVRRSGTIVGDYYAGFPVRAVRIEIDAVEGARVSGGRTFGRPAPLIRLRVGREVSADMLRDDWVLVHEMVHLALPEIGEEHTWLSEGLATYVEGVARVQARNRTVEDFWAENARMMPKGLPDAGDEGLDHTHTWARTYWGGALYCLLADVEIRQRTANQRGLREALRAITRASGGLGTSWPIERVLAVGDGAVGVPVLETLDARMKDAPVSPDLPALWRQLGIEVVGDSVRFHDDAPLAAIRAAITR